MTNNMGKFTKKRYKEKMNFMSASHCFFIPTDLKLLDQPGHFLYEVDTNVS